MTYNIIATGSGGNAVIINDNILIDCGVSYKRLQPYITPLRLVLLTHEHGDHFRSGTVRALHRERPALRWGCCAWMVPHLLAAGVDKRVIDVYEFAAPGKSGMLVYKHLAAIIKPEMLYHNVSNCGWHIWVGLEKVFYATDTGTLDGIEAKDYDLYMIEANNTQEEIEARLRAKEAAGEFAYETAAMQNHLSQEQALDWLAKNMGSNSRFLFMHQHQERGAAHA